MRNLDSLFSHAFAQMLGRLWQSRLPVFWLISTLVSLSISLVLASTGGAAGAGGSGEKKASDGSSSGSGSAGGGGGSSALPWFSIMTSLTVGTNKMRLLSPLSFAFLTEVFSRFFWRAIEEVVFVVYTHVIPSAFCLQSRKLVFFVALWLYHQPFLFFI